MTWATGLFWLVVDDLSVGFNSCEEDASRRVLRPMARPAYTHSDRWDGAGHLPSVELLRFVSGRDWLKVQMGCICAR